jgi:hypoxanthine phosphoribosyltransferase
MPGPRNNAYISKFVGEGMTYKGMTNALKYFYDVKKNSIEKSNNGIGIIPWVYEEAQKYFENKTIGEKIRMEKVEQISEKFEEAEWETRKVRIQKTETPVQLVKTFDLNDFE